MKNIPDSGVVFTFEEGISSGGARKIIKPGQKFKDSKFTLYIICK